LRVYLATDSTGDDRIDLGELRANQGNLVYDVPESIDTEEYNTVIIWCKAFGVLFGSAELN